MRGAGEDSYAICIDLSSTAVTTVSQTTSPAIITYAVEKPQVSLCMHSSVLVGCICAVM